MIEGDSKEYEVFEEAIKQLTNPIGATVEIGVRRGMGSKMIIDSFRKHHPNVKLNHLGIDPYGNIEYNPMEAHLNVRLDYTIKSLAPRHSKLGDKKLDVRLYTGNQVLELAACGLKLDACCLGLEACRLHLEQLGA
jgi:hypothetical protein